MYASFWPSINNPQMQQALEGYPEALKEAFNMENLTTAAGYLGSSVYGVIVAVLTLIFAIAWGTRAIAGDEEAGTLDLILAHPVGRRSLAIQRFAALAVGLGLLGIALFAVMVALSGPVQLEGITPAEFAATSLQLALFGLCFGALAFALGAITGRRGFTLGASAGLTVILYVANALLPQVDGLEWARNLSPFHWYLGGDPLAKGLNIGDSLLMLVVAAVLLLIGLWRFDRRDIAV
jgi:ABC-2 type transport system permease protein